jgi:Uma2 family endonuclease
MYTLISEGVMVRMNEVNIEKRLKLKVQQMGGLALKLISPGNAGVPDRLILFKNARVAFVELKSPSKKLRALQRKRKNQLEEMGFKVYTIDSYKDIDMLLLEMVL